MKLQKWISATVAVALFATTGAYAQLTTVESGHTAAWYDPSRDGEGWVLEVHGDDRASVYWYTYDNGGGQRWMTGIGQVLSDENGQYIDVAELVVTRGAVFGDAFDPDDVVRETVGSASIRFRDCHEGIVSWTAFGESAETDITRLTRTMGAGCESINGIPGEPVQPYAGQSGDWYDTEHNGEGFTVQWLTRDEALVFWFTYDDQGNQTWMTGLGYEDDGEIVIPELTATRGGRFGAAFNAGDVERFPWGQMDMSLTCNDGGMNYVSELQGFGSGSQNLRRLSLLANPACPYVKPNLDDLYGFKWTELPMPDDGSIEARRVTDAGAVIGMRSLTGEGEGEIVILTPGATEWTTLNSRSVWRDGPVLSNEAADRVVASEVPDQDQLNPYEPLAWWSDTGWATLDGIDRDYSLLTGGDREGNVLVGRSFNSGDRHYNEPWIWDPVGGQRNLARLGDGEDGAGSHTPTAAANDGSVVVGIQSGPTITPPYPWIQFLGYRALRWTPEGEVSQLHSPDGTPLAIAKGCDADCNVIFGDYYQELLVGDERIDYPQSWFWTPDGRFGVLEPLIKDDMEHETVAIDAAGTLIVGTAPSYVPPVTPAPAKSQAFAWTQRTGTVRLADFASMAASEQDTWDSFSHESRSMDVSADGTRILISLYEKSAGDPGTPVRSGVLTLMPKD